MASPSSPSPSLIRRGQQTIWFHLRHLLLRRYRVRYQYNPKHLVADVLILVAVIALIIVNGYIFLVFTKWAISLQVQVGISGPEIVRSGLPVEYTVTVNNTARRGSLTEVVLALDIPDTFQIKTVSVPLNQQHQITFDAIAPRQQQRVVITGVWWGNHGQQYRLSARASYRQSSPVDQTLQWSDERDHRSTITIQGSAIGCVMAAPAQGVGGAYAWLTVQCKNDGSQTIDQVTLADTAKIITGLPEHSLPAPTAAGTWPLGPLEPGQASDPIRLLVQLSGAPEQSAVIPLELRGTFAGTEWLLDRPTATIQLVPSPVAITFTSNGQANFAPQPGEDQTIVVSIQNITDQTLTGVIPVVDFSASLFDRSSITSQPAGEWQNDWLVWPAQAVAAGEEAVVTFTATTPATGVAPEQQLLVGMVQDAQQNLATPTLAQWVALTQPFSSRLELTALARYYTRDGEQIGLGPLPPLVGFPTRYRVFFEVASDRHPLSLVQVTSVLPKNVIWDAESCTSISTGFTFNADNRSLVWQAGPVGATQSAVASFCLTLSPLTSQVGSFAPLLLNIVATGTDSITGRQLEITRDTITTALPFDPFTAGRGRISK